MRTSARGIAEIAGHEGVVLAPYRDSKGIWTIFVGHTASAGPPDPSTLPRGVDRPISEAMKVFKRDLSKFEARVNKHVKVPLAQHEFDALASFDLNTGGIYYRNKAGKWVNASLVNHLNAGNRQAAAKAFMNWRSPPEIIGRRKKEMELFRSGKYSGGGHAPLYTADARGRTRSIGRVNVLEHMDPAGNEIPVPPERPTGGPGAATGIAAMFAITVATVIAWWNDFTAWLGDLTSWIGELF